MISPPITQSIELWPIERLREYPRNPRKNDAVVDRMCASIREFGFKIPCLVRSDGEVVDGHLRLKAARKLSIAEIPVILCDEWTPAQVKAFRLMVNRSVTWADWDTGHACAAIPWLRQRVGPRYREGRRGNRTNSRAVSLHFRHRSIATSEAVPALQKSYSDNAGKTRLSIARFLRPADAVADLQYPRGIHKVSSMRPI